MTSFEPRRRPTLQALLTSLTLVTAVVACSQVAAPATPPPGIGGIGSFALPSFGAPVLPSLGAVVAPTPVAGAVPTPLPGTLPPPGTLPTPLPGARQTFGVPGAPGVPVVPGGPAPATFGIPGEPGAVAPGAGTTQGPPAWVKPGERVTFYAGAASVAQSRFSYVEDPNGDLEDPRTGKKYRKTDPSSEPTATASGDGMSQVDIIAVEGTDVVISDTLYGIDHTINQFTAFPGTGARVPGASVQGVYVHPDLLAQLSMQDLGGLLVLRGDYPVGQTTYHAVSFVNTDPAAYASYTYDRDTGVLLSSTTSTAGATSPVTQPGVAPPQGNTYLTITRLIGMRQRSLPGLDGTNPDWLARTSQLQYTGTYNTTSTIDPSSLNVTFPMQSTVSFGQGGRNWAPYTAQTVIQQPGAQPTTASGVTGTTGVYWVDPRALAGLAAGQVLDQDPLTTEQVVVATVDGGTVSITSQLPGVSTRTTYDRASGVLLAFEAHQNGAAAATTVQLQLQDRP